MAITLTGNTVIKLDKKEAWPLVKLVYPEYTGRKFVMEFTDRVWFHDTNWGGGTRNQYKAVKSDGRIYGFSAPAPWVNPIEGTSAPTTPDVLVIVHKVFCGQDCGIRIYAHPSLAPKWLKEG